MPKIDGYCRVSSDEQARSGLGLESQQYICEHYMDYIWRSARKRDPHRHGIGAHLGWLGLAARRPPQKGGAAAEA